MCFGGFFTCFTAKCAAGTFSDSGMPPCNQCPRNSYWNNSTSCTACPNDGKTNSAGAMSVGSCISKSLRQITQNNYNTLYKSFFCHGRIHYRRLHTINSYPQKGCLYEPCEM